MRAAAHSVTSHVVSHVDTVILSPVPLKPDEIMHIGHMSLGQLKNSTSFS